jgi:hypothetical protein
VYGAPVTFERPWWVISVTTTSGSSVSQMMASTPSIANTPLDCPLAAKWDLMTSRPRSSAGCPADPGEAFFAFLGRFREEAAAKRDLPDAIAVPGALQEELHAGIDVLLRRAKQAGAVRADISTPDLLVLLKGLVRSINDAQQAGADPELTGRLMAVVIDGLRARLAVPVHGAATA